MENIKIKKDIRTFYAYRLVKSEDLNHHGTLFAGRCAEWFVESGFVAASYLLNPKFLICLKIHGLEFLKPVRSGETICFSSKVVYAGITSLNTYVKVCKNNLDEHLIVDSFITFVHVDDNTKPCPHNLEMIATTDEDKILQQQAVHLKKQRN
jgi:acyl-CoA hydrolase